MELKDLKVGDKVVRFANYHITKIYTIKKLTKMWIVLEPPKEFPNHNLVFNRLTGKRRALSKWDTDYIVVPTKELIEHVKLLHLRRMVREVLGKISNLENLDKEECYAIYRLLQPLIDKRNTKENSNE